MNKELEALEVSKQLKDFVLEFVKNGLDRIFVNGSFDIIETALKRGIDYENKYCELQAERIVEKVLSQNQLKALEIIKEKRIDVSTLLESFQPSKQTLNGIGKNNFNGYTFYDVNYYQYDDKQRTLTLEEYNLLKEVLL